MTGIPEIVPDPVSHISISGARGPEEVEARVAHLSSIERRAPRRASMLGTLLLGAAIGAGLMYLFDPVGGATRREALRGRVSKDRA